MSTNKHNSRPSHNRKLCTIDTGGRPSLYGCQHARSTTEFYMSVYSTGRVNRGADWRSGERRGLRTKGSLVKDLAAAQLVVALSKSHLRVIYPLLSTG